MRHKYESKNVFPQQFSNQIFNSVLQHDSANLQSVGQGENLYCGFGDGCMAKTVAEHMEIGLFIVITHIMGSEISKREINSKAYFITY